MGEYERNVNSQANLREYLVERFDHMLISSVNTIKIQATSLAELTRSSNQLSRAALVRSFSISHDGRVITFNIGESIATLLPTGLSTVAHR
jgi:hypothetical protein